MGASQTYVDARDAEVTKLPVTHSGVAPDIYRVFFLLCRKVWMMTFCKVPSAGGLIQQLPTAHAGQWNIPKCHLTNLATEQKKYSVR